MKYLLAIYGNEDIWTQHSPEHWQQIIKETDAHNASLFASGELIGAYGVADQTEAKRSCRRRCNRRDRRAVHRGQGVPGELLRDRL